MVRQVLLMPLQLLVQPARGHHPCWAGREGLHADGVLAGAAVRSRVWAVRRAVAGATAHYACERRGLGDLCVYRMSHMAAPTSKEWSLFTRPCSLSQRLSSVLRSRFEDTSFPIVLQPANPPFISC